eukprot:7372022-Lingulodinium_polyedra.AAC.1
MDELVRVLPLTQNGLSPGFMFEKFTGEREHSEACVSQSAVAPRFSRDMYGATFHPVRGIWRQRSG